MSIQIAQPYEIGPAVNPFQPYAARIVGINKMVEDNHLFQFRFVEQDMAASFAHRPGQFIELSIIGVGEAPISISSSPTRAGILELCVRRVGRLTNALYAMKTNDLVGIRGPYGNGYPVDKFVGKEVYIVQMFFMQQLTNFTLQVSTQMVMLVLSTALTELSLMEMELL